MTVIALIDADNFYVSVERIFRADLQGKPVVVLSSNDSNVIARSSDYVEYSSSTNIIASHLGPR